MSRAAAKEDAATVVGPLRSKVIILSVTSTSSRFVIPDIMVGRYCSFLCDGDDCDIVFGTSAQVLTYAKAASVSTEVITVSANSGWNLQNGVERDWIVPKSTDATHFAVVTSSGAAKLYIRPSGP